MRRPGFEPGPPAWKAGILATILPAHEIVIKKEVLKFSEPKETLVSFVNFLKKHKNALGRILRGNYVSPYTNPFPSI